MEEKDKHILSFLTNDLNEAEKKDLIKDDQMKEQINDYKELWEKSSELSEFGKINLEQDWQKVRKKMGFGIEQKSRRIPFRKYILRISAILVLAFGLAYFFNTLVKEFPEKSQVDYLREFAKAEVQPITMPDGSLITLNIGAEVFYNTNYGVENRDVILTGEAFFEVTPNKELPFKVYVSNSTIEVLGTSFNIKESDDIIDLDVVSGRVAFFETSDKTNRIEVVKDQAAEFDSKQQLFKEVSIINPNHFAWKTGVLDFRQENMYNALQTIANYYNLKLDVKTQSGMDGTLTGNFDNKSVEEVLDYIVTTQSRFIAEVTDKKIIIRE